MAKILLLPVAFGALLAVLLASVASASALPAPPAKPVAAAAIHHGQHNHLSQRQQLILEQQQLQKQLQLERANQRANDLPPSLSDSLAVAKSPLEPVTMPFSWPAARNDELVAATTLAAASQPHAQFERSTTLQGQDETSAGALSETTGLERSTTLGLAFSSSSSTPTSSSFEDAARTELPQTTPTTNEPTEATESSTTESTTASTTTTTTTTTTARTEAPSSEEPSSTSAAERQSDEALSTSTTTTTTTVEPTSSTTEAPTTTPKPTLDESATTTTESPRVTSITELSTSSLADGSPEPSTSTSAPPSSTTAAAAEPSSSAAPEEPTTSTTTSTTQAPLANDPSTSAPEVSSSPKPSAPPAASEPADEKDNQASKRPCNHLPTYDSEEIQKVFREETTYKNGTIKGKFTYINFDQRYRLVHYTRLPYGPVKIDLVEELGRPEQANGSSNSVVELPNAVLQLRNILPNSLFGFPFLGSTNPAASSAQAAVVATASGHDNDKSSMYFYSTDTIATPNLLGGSVPVSVLPGQRRLSQPVNVPTLANGDTLGASYFENLQVGSNKVGSGPRALQKNETSEAPKMLVAPPPFFGQSNQNQFQYAYANAAANAAALPNMAEPLKQPAGLLYNYLAPQPHQAQYQYSPVPLYTFSQPTYFYSQTAGARQLSSQQAALPTIYATNNKLKAPQVPSSPPAAFNSEAVLVNNGYTTPQSHQLHSHEHYVAPFMHTQPQGAPILSGPTSRSLEVAPGRQVAPEAPKLKLKVKNAKALAASNQQRQREIQQQHEARQAKSAQLRVAPVSAPNGRPVNSPAQIHRVQQQHRQRIGKQNQQLRASPGAVNSSPVVYHVLRNPAGEMYSSIPNYYGRAQLVQ